MLLFKAPWRAKPRNTSYEAACYELNCPCRRGPASAKHLRNSGIGPYGLCGASIRLSRLSTRDKFSSTHSLTSLSRSILRAKGCVRRPPAAARLQLQHFVMGTSTCAAPGAWRQEWVLITLMPMGAMRLICSHGKARQRKARQSTTKKGKARPKKSRQIKVREGKFSLLCAVWKPWTEGVFRDY